MTSLRLDAPGIAPGLPVMGEFTSGTSYQSYSNRQLTFLQLYRPDLCVPFLFFGAGFLALLFQELCSSGFV
jgi:hypothetical protein